MNFRKLLILAILLLTTGCGRSHHSSAIPPIFAGLLSASAVSDSAIQLSWLPATDRETPQSQMVYLVYLATVSGQEDFSNPVATTDPGATAYTVGNLAPSTIYYFVVRAKNRAGGIDKNTVEKSATTAATSENPDSDTTPPIVSITAPEAWSILSGSTTLTATATDNVGVVDIEFFANDTISIGSRATSGLNVSAVLSWDTTTTADGLYTLTAKAFDRAGNNTTSAGVVVSVGNTPDANPPSVPQGLSATAVSAARIDLRWNASTDATDNGPGQVAGYRVERSTDNTSFAEITIAKSPFYADAERSAGTTYYYHVRAFDLKGNSSNFSTTANATTFAVASAVTLGGSLNVDSSGDARNPSLVLSSGGALYGIWRERGQIYVKQWMPSQGCWGDGAGCGNLVGGAGLRPGANAGTVVEYPGLVTMSGYLYAAWEEFPNIRLVKARRCLIANCSWQDLPSPLESSDWASAPFINTDGSAPYLAWDESTASRQELWVKRFNEASAMWEDAGNRPLNISPSADADQDTPPAVAFSDAGIPYVAWAEPDGNPNRSNQQIWIKRLDSGLWGLVGTSSLNINSTREARAPSLLLRGETPIVAWQEQDVSGLWRIYAKEFMAGQSCWGDGTTCGALLGGGMISGSGDTRMTVVNPGHAVSLTLGNEGIPYAAFAEIDLSNTGRVYVKQLLCPPQSVCTWDIVGGGSLNVNNKYAFSPHLLFRNDRIYLAWQENAGTADIPQVYVREICVAQSC